MKAKMVYRSLILFIIIICINCSGCSRESSTVLVDFGKRAVDMHMSNYYHRESIQKVLLTHQDSALLKNILDIALTIDTLAVTYLEQSGGVTQDLEILDVENRGAGVVKAYRNYNIESKLNLLLAKNKSLQTGNKRLIENLDFLVKKNFSGTDTSFSERSLKEKPFSMIFFELALIENQVFLCLFKYFGSDS